MQWIVLIVGLVLIIKSADILIDSAAEIAKRFGVPPFVVGVTVIAFGTSAPELAVGILSGVEGANALTLGNVIGSTFSNMALIVGISAFVYPLAVKKSIMRREFPMLLVVEAAVLVMLLVDNHISRIDGIALMGLFVLFMFYVVRSAGIEDTQTKDADNGSETLDSKKPRSTGFLSILTLLALAGLFAGGKLTVDSSSAIALSFGMSETLIGMTVVAIATTMPELMTSIAAVRKKEPDIVLGNAIGSNIFNILLVLGASATIHPITAASGVVWDVVLMIGVTTAVYVFALARGKIGRKVGLLQMAMYAGYMALKVLPVIR